MIKDVTNGYWFLHAYAALMFVAPLINAAFASLEGRSVEDVRKGALLMSIPVMMLVFGWSWLATRAQIFNIPMPRVHGMETHSWLTLLGVYCVARFYRTLSLERVIPMRICWIGVAVLPIMTGVQFGLIGGYNCIFTLLLAGLVFSLFSHVKAEGIPCVVVKAISFLIPSLFAIYLIHQSPVGVKALHTAADMLPSCLKNCVGGIVLGIMAFVMSFFLDLPRRMLVRLVRKPLDMFSHFVDGSGFHLGHSLV